MLIDHKTYSLSSVTDPGSLILSTGVTTTTAMVIAWLVFYLGARVHQMRPVLAAQAIFKFIFSMLAFLSIPVLLNYVYNGLLITWALPDFLVAFLGLIFLMQLALVSAVGLVLTAITSLISIFSAKKAVVQEPQWI
jgi:hypothetical protein